MNKIHRFGGLGSLALAFGALVTLQVGCRSTDSKPSDGGVPDNADAGRPDAQPADSGTGGQAAQDSGTDAIHDSGSDSGHDSGTDASHDSGTDASEDAGTDASHDSGTDASHDSGTDASEDAGTDASHDSGIDASEDAGTDASQDSSTDAGEEAGTDANQDASDASQDSGTDASEDADTDAGGENDKTWGWISAIEWNDVCDQWYSKTQWFGGVRAYFATAPEYNRGLPHTLGFATATLSDGACTLYDSGLMSDDCLGYCLCLDKGVECTQGTARWCDEEHVCVEDAPDSGSDGHCVPLPPHFDVGDISITGLKTSVTMAPDSLDRYIFASPPEDLFDMGDTIVASTSGGERPPMTFTARGVAPLEVPDNVVRYRSGVPATVSWTPADPDSRVQIYLAAGSHDPNPLGGAILCDVPDSDGEVEIAADLLDQLWYLGCNGNWMIKCSRITRYSRDLQTGPGKEVELFVGSARNLQLLHE